MSETHEPVPGSPDPIPVRDARAGGGEPPAPAPVVPPAANLLARTDPDAGGSALTLKSWLASVPPEVRPAVEPLAGGPRTPATAPEQDPLEWFDAEAPPEAAPPQATAASNAPTASAAGTATDVAAPDREPSGVSDWAAEAPRPVVFPATAVYLAPAAGRYTVAVPARPPIPQTIVGTVPPEPRPAGEPREGAAAAEIPQTIVGTVPASLRPGPVDVGGDPRPESTPERDWFAEAVPKVPELPRSESLLADPTFPESTWEPTTIPATLVDTVPPAFRTAGDEDLLSPAADAEPFGGQPAIPAAPPGPGPATALAEFAAPPADAPAAAEPASPWSPDTESRPAEPAAASATKPALAAEPALVEVEPSNTDLAALPPERDASVPLAAVAAGSLVTSAAAPDTVSENTATEAFAHAHEDVEHRTGILSYGLLTKLGGLAGLAGCAAGLLIMLAACAGLSPVRSDTLLAVNENVIRWVAVSFAGLLVLQILAAVLVKGGWGDIAKTALATAVSAAVWVAIRQYHDRVAGFDLLGQFWYVRCAGLVGLGLAVLGGFVEYRKLRQETAVLAACFVSILAVAGGIALQAAAEHWHLFDAAAGTK